jgi:phage tail-like protein
VLPTHGRWLSEAIDSGRYQCSWHRVVVGAEVEPGTRVELRTHTAHAPAAAAALPDSEWQLTGRLDPGSDGDDVLVLSPPGRYLWLRLDLIGDGYRSPVVNRLRLEYPRSSYLRFLPAVYSADPSSADFLARFLSIAQAELERLEASLDNLPALFDPDAVPTAFIDYLGSWLDIQLEGTWTDAAKRRFLRDATGYFRRRGTPAAIRAHVAAYLRGMTGVDLPEGTLPQLVEGFRERRYQTVPAAVGGQRPLASRAVVGRLQTDRFDRLGDVRLISAGDPDVDTFAEHAHRFRVFVPAALVRTADDERMLRRALDAERPAHTVAELELVRPALRVGIQASLGVDSLLAAPSPARLACRAGEGGASAPETGWQLGSRLDGLAVLGSRTCGGGIRLNDGNTVGSLLTVL